MGDAKDTRQLGRPKSGVRIVYVRSSKIKHNTSLRSSEGGVSLLCTNQSGADATLLMRS
ncbi:uncharacterized protein J3R85_005389 [Psidium guajava]|nr:uncharacterized protein J3R85_005389 [Psidium guajava]